MTFHQNRRQQFLTERSFNTTRHSLNESIEYFDVHPVGSGVNAAHRIALGLMTSADDRLNRLTLDYTAGEPITPLRHELEDVVAAYERYTAKLREYEENQNAVPLLFGEPGHYLTLLQLIGLCFLLHRRDLLPRIAAMQDGADAVNGGADALFEEFLIFGVGPELRYQSDYLHELQPYEHLFYALTEDDKGKAFDEINTYLKVWYRELKGLPQHDTHKPDENGNQNGYYGYWSFEAGAAVVLLGIEDDRSLHQYLYYPKDLVAWSRNFQPESAESASDPTRRRVEADTPCPQSGWWMTPAKANSRRYFKQGETMPALGGDYGLTIWQWDVDQSVPKL